MTEPPGYRLREALGNDARRQLWRGVRERDGQAVLLKRAPPGLASPLAVAALRREAEVRLQLEGAGLPRVLASEPGLLVLEDPGGEPLREVLAGQAVPVDRFLPLARQLVRLVATFHDAGFIHRGLDPHGLLASGDLARLALVDWSTASRLTAGGVPAGPGLTALSPEQTGRMNRGVDHRTDFYALGALFYELLTGRPPFGTGDPLELAHRHIALRPTPPAELEPRVPGFLSEVTLKLLAKMAEDRYQSLPGLLRDLDRFEGAAGALAPGTEDGGERLAPPQRLLGREREVARLEQHLARAAAGETVVALVGGPPGIGKSALVAEVGKAAGARQVRFAAGKCDQLERGRPHAALGEALGALCRQVGEGGPEGQRAAAGARLREALGAHAGALLALVPEVEALLGPLVPPPALGPTETRNRLGWAVQQLLGALVEPGVPLVLFLDDLHWAEPATLRLLAALVERGSGLPVLWVGAFRDAELGPEHPLVQFRAGLLERGVPLEELTLAPLRLPQLEAFLGEAVGGDPVLAEALAPVLLEKTQGNPFFLRQFLASLERQGLLGYDPRARRWRADLERIRGADLTDNVVELMTRRLRHLPAATREALTLAAFLGGTFSLATLALVREQPQAEVAAELWEAIAAGLVRPLDADYEVRLAAEALEEERLAYRFVHDRVQQAAAGLTEEEAWPALHLRLGRLLWHAPGGEEERLLEAVEHLGRGRALLSDPAERRQVAALHLAAGRRARSAGAAQTALGRFEVGLSLVEAEDEGPLRWELALHLAECQLVCGQAPQGEEALDALAAAAPTEDLAAEALRLRVVHHEDAGRFGEAVRLGLAALRRFGVELPAGAAEREAALEAALAAIEARLDGEPPGTLAALPAATDAGARRVAALVVAVWPSAFLVGEPFLTSLLSAHLVQLSQAHGTHEGSAIGYVTHAITVNARTRDYRRGTEWGQLGLEVEARAGDLRLRAKTLHLFGSFLAPWAEPLPEGRRHGRAAHQAGLQTGDFTYAGRAAFMETWYAFFPGEPLAAFEAGAEGALDFLRRIGHSAIQQAARVLLQWSRALRGLTRGPTALSDDAFDEAAFAATFAQVPVFLGFLGVAQLGLAVLYGEDDRAWELSLRTERAFGGSAEQLWHSVFDFYRGLAAAAVSARAPGASAVLDAAIERLRLRAEGCAANFEHQHQLLRAERARALGDLTQAVSRYGQAAAAAERAGYPNDRALVLERWARFEAERGEAAAAAGHRRQAVALYRQWGATAKARALEAEDPAPGGLEAPPVAEAFDAASALKAARAIAAEIELERLLPRLVHLVIENAGAERGVLLEVGPGGLTVLAEGTVAGGSAASLPEPLADFPSVPHQLVARVARGGGTVVVADARLDPELQRDGDVRRRQPRSVLCAPIIRQGEVRGVLYLENTLLPEVFTAARAEAVEVLAAQASISLENARLYASMKEEVRRRARAEAALTAALEDLEVLKNRLQAENVYLQEEIRSQQGFDEMVGRSPELLETLRRVEKVAPTESTVLVLGETGTGKELVARAIHQRSRRRERALVKVNCAAIAAGLVESELFGHAKGAFTGALQKRVGRFELADGGTLFLDEVGELPLDTQAKLLRVLQEQEFEPVGSSRTQQVDVRVIAATNRDLSQAVKAGRFREDLLYRLDVFPISLPPLRRRTDDLPLLASFFLERVAKRLGTPLLPFTRPDLARLAAWSWPGNVRELQNVVERAAILARDGVPNLQAALPEAAGGAGAPRTPLEGEAPASEAIEEVERAHIVAVLRRTAWVVEGTKGAASILQLHPNTLRSRMKRLGIVRDDG